MVGTPAPYRFVIVAIHRKHFIKIGTPAKGLPKVSPGFGKAFHTGSTFYGIALM
jgi:hypothetical protein